MAGRFNDGAGQTIVYSIYGLFLVQCPHRPEVNGIFFVAGNNEAVERRGG